MVPNQFLLMTSDQSRQYDAPFGPVVAFLISLRVVLDLVQTSGAAFFKADSGPTAVIGANQVRWIVAIVFALGAIGCIAYQFDEPTALNSSPLAASRWRRTNNGWERLISNQVSERSGDGADLPPPHPHPIVFALFLTMASMFVLLACNPSSPHSMQAADSQQASNTRSTPRRLNSI